MKTLRRTPHGSEDNEDRILDLCERSIEIRKTHLPRRSFMRARREEGIVIRCKRLVRHRIEEDELISIKESLKREVMRVNE